MAALWDDRGSFRFQLICVLQLAVLTTSVACHSETDPNPSPKHAPTSTRSSSSPGTPSEKGGTLVPQARVKAIKQLNRAIGLVAKDELEQAVVEMRKAIELDPSYGETRYNLGAILARQGDVDAAVREFEAALELDTPNESRGKFRRGYARHLIQHSRAPELVQVQRQELLERAQTLLRDALDLDPGSAITHYQLGLLLRERGEEAAAKGELKRALELDPHLTRAREALEQGPS